MGAVTRHELTSRETAERDYRLDHDLTRLHRIVDPGLNRLRLQLKESRKEYVREHAFRIAHDMAFSPKPRPVPRLENAVDEITVRTSSEKKWLLTSHLILQAGYKPIHNIPEGDENSIHSKLRQRRDFSDIYALKVASNKQSLLDGFETPLMTLDTVTYIDGVPVEKPQDLVEARKLIVLAAEKRVITETAWVLSILAKSNVFVISLGNRTGISYVIRPISTEEIDDYLVTTPTALNVPVGIDLSNAQARMRFIDMERPVRYYNVNHIGKGKRTTLDDHDLESPLFDPFFSGVPTYAINALLPLVNDIYRYGDPYFAK